MDRRGNFPNSCVTLWGGVQFGDFELGVARACTQGQEGLLEPRGFTVSSSRDSIYEEGVDHIRGAPIVEIHGI